MTKMKNALAASLAIGTMIATGVAAQDISISHDKNSWEEGFVAYTAGGSAASGINIGNTLVSPADAYQAFVQTSISAGDTPPIFTWWSGAQLDSVAETGELADLTEYWDRAIANGEFPASTKDLFSSDGVPVAIPLNLATWVVNYNLHAFEAAGLDGPPETWEELEAAAEALKAAGYIPFMSPGTNGWMGFVWFQELMVRISPEAYLGLADGSTKYNGPEVQQAFTIWGDFYERGFFTDPRDQEFSKYFSNGEAAMYLLGDWSAGIFDGEGLKAGEDFSAFIMPTVSPDTAPGIILEAAPIMFSKDYLAENPELGAAIDYWMTADAANAMTSNGGPFNGNSKADMPNAILETVGQLLAAKDHVAVVRWWESVPADLQGDLQSLMSSFMVTPTPENAQKVMDDMEALASAYWAENS